MRVCGGVVFFVLKIIKKKKKKKQKKKRTIIHANSNKFLYFLLFIRGFWEFYNSGTKQKQRRKNKGEIFTIADKKKKGLFYINKKKKK